jgi:hypothetical protein
MEKFSASPANTSIRVYARESQEFKSTISFLFKH